jgi:ABC-type branched-subunit amino acid transport system ATPase component
VRGVGVLDVEALTVCVGGVTALDAVDACVPEGAICGVIGPDGAGRSTFLEAITEPRTAPKRGDDA